MPSIGVVLSDLVPDSLVSRFERILSCYADFRKDIEKQIKEKPLRPPPPAIKSKGISYFIQLMVCCKDYPYDFSSPEYAKLLGQYRSKAAVDTSFANSN